MSVPKRLCLLVFGLCGLLCLTALTLPWLGPWTAEATELLSVRWYYLAVEACLVVTVVGLFVSLLRSLFSPRRRREVEVSRIGDDTITVTCAAIASHVTHVVEHRGAYVADRVRVHARKRSVHVTVRVRPTHPLNAPDDGTRLHAALMDSLTTLVGDAITGVDLEFIEPDQAAESVSFDSSFPVGDGSGSDEGMSAADGVTVPLSRAIGDIAPETDDGGEA